MIIVTSVLSIVVVGLASWALVEVMEYDKDPEGYEKKYFKGGKNEPHNR
jgi:hypothetical protein